MGEKKIIYCENIEESEAKYREYIVKHIKAVQEAYYIAIDTFKEVFPEVYNNKAHHTQLINNLRTHDRSKFDANEFWYYAARFFPIKGTDINSNKVKDKFQLAWLHHVHNNAHHPAHWALADDGGLKILDMPDIYIIEMLCDWMAMSKYYNSTTLNYWNSESASKLPMSVRTVSKVDKFMIWMQENNVHMEW